MSWTIYPRRSNRLHFITKIEEKNRCACHTSTLKAKKAHQSALISERLDLFDRVLQWMSILDRSISQCVFVFTHQIENRKMNRSFLNSEHFEAEERKIGVCSVTFWRHFEVEGDYINYRQDFSLACMTLFSFPLFFSHFTEWETPAQECRRPQRAPLWWTSCLYTGASLKQLQCHLSAGTVDSFFFFFLIR